MLHVLLLSLLLIVLINITGYTWAFKNQKDSITDLTYSASFIIVGWTMLYLFGDFNKGSVILMTMVTLWATRLGLFLFIRIHHIGKDDRFDSFRSNPIGYLKFWLLQSFSIWIISIPVLIYVIKQEVQPFLMAGIFIWLTGWIIESIADCQKFYFKKKNPEDYYKDGLYAIVQYPNYLGEILCWIGIFVFVFPALQDWEYVSIISPLWIIYLLVRVSGIPLLEKKTKKRYGAQEEVMAYKKQTPKLIPFIY